LNRQIGQLFVLTGLLFAVLVGFTSYWTVLDAEGLEDNTANRRPLIEQQRVPRGLILARDNRPVLARSRGEGTGDARIFTRFYPTGPLFSHAVGYSFIERGSAGLEKSYDDELAGREDEFGTILQELEDRDREGNDVVTNLDPEGQRAAIQGLGGQRGSIVAIEPQTGKVRVMVSIPDFDANQIPDRFSQLNRAPGSPLLNRATQARYPPGSTFKVVTAAAALDTGKYNPNSVVDGSSPKNISGVPLANFGGQDFGPVSLTDALTNSVNTVWAQVGVDLGKRTMYDYMERFGFNQRPPLDYPPEQMDASGVFSRGRLLTDNDPVDIGRVAIGQERLQVTPLQMAMVVAAVGNGGTLIKPRLVDRIVQKDGRVKRRIEADRQSQVISRKAADELAQMMSRVVEEGTGTAAALSGIRVAGKTGTAEVDNGAANQAWFIGFAPVDNPRMAIAVTVERTQGQGGTVAAPIAKRVLETLLRNE
jgi:peptidoglycan glycosyltransferase